MTARHRDQRGGLRRRSWRVAARVGTRGIVVFVLLSLLTPLAVGWSAELTPLVVGWERFFKLDWQPGERNGRPVVYGHILNDWGLAAKNIRLLVEGIDPAGRVLWQKVEWLGGQLAPGQRAPFEVAVQAPAPAYRVRVFAFDWVQTGGGDDR